MKQDSTDWRGVASVVVGLTILVAIVAAFPLFVTHGPRSAVAIILESFPYIAIMFALYVVTPLLGLGLLLLLPYIVIRVIRAASRARDRV